MIDYRRAHEVGHDVGIDHHDPTDGSPHTRPIFCSEKGMGPAPSFEAMLCTPFRHPYCRRCLDEMKVSDKYGTGL